MSPKEMENVCAASGDAAHSPYPDTGRYPWRRSVIRADAISAGRAQALNPLFGASTLCLGFTRFIGNFSTFFIVVVQITYESIGRIVLLD